MTKLAVITGASSGIGRETALLMAKRGYQVIACVRRREDGERLQHDAGDGLEVCHVDVRDAGDVALLAGAVEKKFSEDGAVALFALVNNAGISPVAPIEMLDIDELQSVFETNVFGMVRVTQALLPFLKYTTGRIVNISSGAGVIAIPFSGAYSMSKFSVEALSDVLRVELQQFGIRVSVVEPGLISTPIHEKNNCSIDRLVEQFDAQQRDSYGDALASYVEMQEMLGRAATPARAVSKTIIKAIESRKPKSRYSVGRDALVLRSVQRLLTDPVRDRLAARIAGW